MFEQTHNTQKDNDDDNDNKNKVKLIIIAAANKNDNDNNFSRKKFHKMPTNISVIKSR